MPPRRVAELVPQPPFAPLPCELAALIFKLLPVDTRLRCREVSRGWRDALEDFRLWEELDLSHASGVTLTPALLCAASLRAHGRVHTLELTGWNIEDVAYELIVSEAAANKGSLTTLRLAGSTFLVPTCVDAVTRAAPLLKTLECDVECSPAEAPAILSCADAYSSVRVRSLYVCQQFAQLNDVVDVVGLAAAAAAHGSLERLRLQYIILTVAALEALVDAALLRRLTTVSLVVCALSELHLPALTRLLGCSELRGLTIGHTGDPPLLVSAEAAAEFWTALRASKLTRLGLLGVSLWTTAADADAAAQALAGHPTLTECDLAFNSCMTALQPAVGAALQRIADAGTLSELYVSYCHLGDAGMRPLLRAVEGSRTLRVLGCFGNGISAEFAREYVLPAVRANTSLRQIVFFDPDEDEEQQAELAMAEALVSSRPRDGRLLARAPT